MHAFPSLYLWAVWFLFVFSILCSSEKIHRMNSLVSIMWYDNHYVIGRKLYFDKVCLLHCWGINPSPATFSEIQGLMWVQADTQLVLGGLLHQQGELPHELTAELVLLRRSRHHGQPDGLSHTGHGVEVADGHPGDEVQQGREGWKKGEGMERANERSGKERKQTEREQTRYCLSE